MNSKAAEYLENGFLSAILKKDGITDISFNGRDIYFATNDFGREKAELDVTPEYCGDFLRQIANLCERPFSFSEPILDVSFGRYRLNAVYRSLARDNNEKTYTFSIRIERECAVRKGDRDFFPGDSERILLELLSSGESIVIGGPTSSGKTELEKYLISNLPPATRLVVIDNVEELSFAKRDEIDMTHWLVRDGVPGASFPDLVRNALRNDPDYIVVAEARGSEMLDALAAAMSGHRIITSVHAKNLLALPSRIARLAMQASPKLERESLLEDVSEHIGGYVFLQKERRIDGSIRRHLHSIGRLDPKSGQMKILYEEVG